MPRPQIIVVATRAFTISKFVGTVAGPLPLPLVIAAVAATSVVEYKVDEDDKAKKMRDYERAVQQWRASLFPPCVKHVKDRAGLMDARWYLRNGRMPPTSEIIIAPPYGKEILSVFREANKFLLRDKIEQIEMAEEVAGFAISAATLLGLGLPLNFIYATLAAKGMMGLIELASQSFQGIKTKTASAFEVGENDRRIYGGKLAKFVVTKHKGKNRHTAAFSDFLAMEAGWIVWEMACNGMKPITTADGYVLLRWGERKDDDFK